LSDEGSSTESSLPTSGNCEGLNAGGPDLVSVASRALPGLNTVSWHETAAGEIEALTLVLKRNSQVTGVKPRLSRQVVEASPNLHRNAISRFGSSIQAEIGAVKPDLCTSRVDDPILSRGAIAVVNLNSRAVSSNPSSDIQTSLGNAMRMNLNGGGFRWSRRCSRSSRGRNCNSGSSDCSGKVDGLPLNVNIGGSGSRGSDEDNERAHKHFQEP